MTTAPATIPSIAVQDSTEFIDRRSSSKPAGGFERRQFGNSHVGLSPAAQELAETIDNYKLQHRRRFITYEEMLHVINALGYKKS